MGKMLFIRNIYSTWSRNVPPRGIQAVPFVKYRNICLWVWRGNHSKSHFMCWDLGWSDFQGKIFKMLLDLPGHGFNQEGATPSPKIPRCPTKKARPHNPDTTCQEKSSLDFSGAGISSFVLALNSKFSGKTRGHWEFSSWVMLMDLWSLDGSLGFPTSPKSHCDIFSLFPTKLGFNKACRDVVLLRIDKMEIGISVGE